jgi:hypothetical protein
MKDVTDGIISLVPGVFELLLRSSDMADCRPTYAAANTIKEAFCTMY